MKLIAPDGTEYRLERPHITIGRGSSSDIQLADPRVSRNHAVLHLGIGEYIIEDLGSTNWTLVNGQRVEGQRPIKDGDHLTFADTTLIFDTGEVTLPMAAQEPEPAGEEQAPLEQDNAGTRLETVEEANTFWITNESAGRHEPFIQHRFPTAPEARQALLALPFIHTAADSGKPISSVPLAFGTYEAGPGLHDLILWGTALTPELWQAARAICAEHGGIEMNVRQPQPAAPAPPQAAPTPAAPPPAVEPAAAPDIVTFVREDRKPASADVVYVYRIYQAPDEASARAFLQRTPVTELYTYLIVETPEGNFGRDMQGIFRE